MDTSSSENNVYASEVEGWDGINMVHTKEEAEEGVTPEQNDKFASADSANPLDPVNLSSLCQSALSSSEEANNIAVIDVVAMTMAGRTIKQG
jgi:hypothetical protein